MRRVVSSGSKGEPKKEKKDEAVKISFDTVNEVVLLAAVVTDERARKRYLQTPPDYFRGAGHATMWAALQELYRRGLDYSPDTLRDLVGDELDAKLLDEYVRSRPEAPPNLAHHVERLRWHKARYDAATGPVSAFLEAFRDTTTNPERVKMLARQVSESFNGHGDLRYLRDSQALVREKSIELTARREGRAIYPYGLEGLDYYGPDEHVIRKGKSISVAGRSRFIPGAAPGDITVVVGRSGNGKTTGIARMVKAIADPSADSAREPRRVLWGSWEQGDKDSLELLAEMSLDLSLTDLRQGVYTTDTQRRVEEEMDRLGGRVTMFALPFGREMTDERKYNSQNMNLIHQYVGESCCQVFVADLFHMSLEQTQPDEVTKALYRMKAIAEDTKTHIFLVHQLRKDLELNEDPRPTRESISGVGSWIDVADTVIAFHRPGLYQGDDDTIEVHVLKQREGPWPFCVQFDWDGEYGSIRNGRSFQIGKPNEKSAVDSWLEDQAPPARRQNSFRRRKY